MRGPGESRSGATARTDRHDYGSGELSLSTAHVFPCADNREPQLPERLRTLGPMPVLKRTIIVGSNGYYTMNSTEDYRLTGPNSPQRLAWQIRIGRNNVGIAFTVAVFRTRQASGLSLVLEFLVLLGFPRSMQCSSCVFCGRDILVLNSRCIYLRNCDSSARCALAEATN